MRVTLTGATGLIGAAVVQRLRDRGDDVCVLSRDPASAGKALGVQALSWDPLEGPAPSAALEGRDGVIHLAGENVAQRWSDRTRRAIRDSRVLGTRNLVSGLRDTGPERPAVLVSASAVGYYGSRGDEVLTEDAPPGEGFLPEVCRAWEAAATEAEGLGMRVVRVRTGVVLDASGGALAKMLPPFRAGVGGPVAGGRQWVPWIHRDDEVSLLIAALDDATWSGPVNATAPEPVTNRELSRALGRALGRPSVLPVPGLAVRALYGDMAEIVTGGQRAVPAQAREHGFRFAFEDVEAALRDALGR